jgi:hypothetical protein
MVRRGRRFESVKGLSEDPANRGLFFQTKFAHFRALASMEGLWKTRIPQAGFVRDRA